MSARSAGHPVPGNRWDLLPAGAGPEPDAAEVTVVVPYYRDQLGLDRLLAALARQDHPLERLQVVVADDGSPEPPRLPRNPAFDLQLVRQPDAGFRASAARALGAAAAEGDVLAFLDGDMVPEPGYLRHATRMPALSPEAVVVGRRRHLEAAWAASGWHPGDPVPVKAALPEPEWLARAYRESRNLLESDAGSYRFVISAVLTVARAVYADAGGFDPAFVGYGGEDWELAHRLWRTGALLAHEPAAVAWHVGPDFAGRGDPAAQRRLKNREALVLAGKVSAPTARGWTLAGHARPRVRFRVDADGGAAALVLCGDALLQAVPAAAVVVSGPAPAGADVLLADPRVSTAGDTEEPVADWEITLRAPLRPAPGTRPDPWAAQQRLLEWERAGIDRVEVNAPGGVVAVAVSSRASWRARRWGPRDPTSTAVVEVADLGWQVLAEEPDLEAWWGGWG